MYSNDGQRANVRLEEIIKAIEECDKETLKAVFSEQALAEAKDIDNQIESLFELTGGSIESLGDRAGTVNTSVNYGIRKSDSRYEYKINTMNGEYMIFIYEITEDTECPENVGLYMLQIYLPEDRDDVFDWGEEKKCAGVYIS